MKHPILTGAAIALFACAMGYSGSADAAWRVPKASTCNESTYGTFSTTTNRFYNADGSLAWTDYATYICDSTGWVLADVTRCLPSGYCVPL
jgi:hypothetical protein